ncbi:MAG: Chemotaxis protein methyltransferase CheR [Pseudomonadota bacterium]
MNIVGANPVAGSGISARAFRTLAGVVHGYCGIALGDDKHNLVANRLRRRLTTLGLSSYDEYCELLAADRSGAELEALIDLITTNHTVFFREPEHFRFLGERVLPVLGPALARAGTAVRLWSAACASGEEPYTMAMVAAEAQRRDGSFQWRLLGSDISRTMVAAATRGVFSSDSLHAVPAELVPRYFLRGVRSQEGYVRIDADLQRQTRFDRINLLDAAYPIGELQHVIFCRNVMIYFDEESRAKVVRQLVRHLLPGGYLFVGYSESLGGLAHGLEAVSHGVYRKP